MKFELSCGVHVCVFVCFLFCFTKKNRKRWFLPLTERNGT